MDDSKLKGIITELDILHRATAPEIVDFYGAFFIESCVYYWYVYFYDVRSEAYTISPRQYGVYGCIAGQVGWHRCAGTGTEEDDCMHSAGFEIPERRATDHAQRYAHASWTISTSRLILLWQT